LGDLVACLGNRLPAVAATEGKHEPTMENLTGEKKKRWKSGQTVMDSCEGIYHGVENEEIYLWVMVVVVGMRRLPEKARRKFAGNLVSSELRRPI